MSTKYIFNPFTGNLDAVDVSGGGGGIVGPGSSTDNAVVRWDGTTGTAVQNSAAILQDGGAHQAQGYIGRKEINAEVVIPAKHYMIASGLTIMSTGSISIGSDSELLLI